MLFTVSIGVVAVYTVAEDPESMETDSQPEINETESSDTSGDQENNLTGETREIYGSGEEREQETEEEKEGIILDAEPVAGESNRIILYESGERVPQETVFINNEEIGQTNDAGAYRFTVPNTEELIISTENNIDEKNVSVELDEKAEIAQDIDVEFKENIYQGNNNTLLIQDEEKKFEGATVYANGVRQGNTNSNGEITFSVPETKKVVILGEIEDQKFEKEFSAKEKEAKFAIYNPKEGKDVSEYKTDFTFDVDARESGNASIILNDEKKRSIDISQGHQTVTENLYINDTGYQEWYIITSLDSGEKIRSETFEFYNSEPLPPVEINLDHKDEESEINDHGANVDFEINTTLDYTFEAIVGEKIFDSFDVQGVYLERLDIPMYGLEPGDHYWTVRVIDEAGRTTEADPIMITTSEEPPIAEYSLEFPEDGGPETSDERNVFQYEVDAYEDVESRLYVDEQLEASNEINVEQGWLFESEFFTKETELGSGSYDWYLEIESLETGEIIQSEVRTTNQ